WNAVPGATRYEVWGSADFFNFEQLGTSTTTSLIADITKGITVEWYVVAANNDCKSESPHLRFTTAGCTGPASMLISPVDGGRSSSPVHFFWSSVRGAIGYRLWIAPYVENGEFEVWDETARTESRAFLAPGQWAWLVESIFDRCDSNYSYYNVFEVPKATNCSTATPHVVSPPIGSTTKSPVTLSWSGVPGAINYQIWASLDDGEAQFVDETQSTSTVVYLGVGHVDWLVIAQFNGCDDAYSEVGSFDVPYDAACDRDAPFPIVPADGADNVPTKVDFIWTPVDGASRYNVWASINDGEAFKVGTTTTTRLTSTLQAGEIAWAVEAEFDGCSPQLSPVSTFVALSSSVCTAPAAPDIFVYPQVNSGEPYYVIWDPGLNTASYEMQESTDPTFASATTRNVNDVLLLLSHQVSTPTRYYYRVRSASNCDAGTGPYSESAAIVIQPVIAQTGDKAGTVASYGTQSQIVQKVHIPGSSGSSASTAGTAQGFTATTDEPWLTVTPSSGTIPPEGIDLTITADPRRLPVGTNTATLRLTTTASAGTPTSVPVSISLVTPVSPDAGTSPLPNSLIIPAVGHAAGAGTTFESDVRITNASAQAMKYLLNFTPTHEDGTKAGQQANLQIEAGDTVALNDILKNFFGFATASDNILGVLEIRPVSSVSGSSNPAGQTNATFASSRTFAVTPNGTYGQFIPAIPFSSFIGRNTTVTLQQIADTARYRTNIGIVEGAGQPATVLLTVRDANGSVISQIEKSLMPGEHQQFPLGVGVENGRIDATVTSQTGKVTAYASVVDRQTNDPMLIMPVNTAEVSANHYVLPGMAQSTGANANWRSDVRLLNAGTTSVPATITYYEQNNPEPHSVTRTINPGQMLVFDQALQSLFGLASSAGGALVVTTPTDSKLIATARTYNLTSEGTYGQFVPGVTPTEGVGVKDRALQVLQAEKSDRFRTNLGIVELTGNPVTVQISAYTPDTKISVSTEWPLGPNAFVQLNDILGRLNIASAYNARISLKVISGNGRIAGYGSLIDNRTSDPTYIPAQ
ncbi:MAG TPA: hypothetical protein VGK04_01090, partial [Thermoanaerobaculia bacterium]